MKVFCIGMHKTATVSLGRLLRSWGYKHLHGVTWSNRAYPEHRELLERYDSFSDGGSHFWDCGWEYDDWGSNHDVGYLTTQFPDAKFVLNVRDLDSWMRSKMRHARWARGQTLDNDATWERIHDRWGRHHSIRALKEFILNRNNYHFKVVSYFKERIGLEKLFVINYIADARAHQKLAAFLGATDTATSKAWANKSAYEPSDYDKFLEEAYKQLEITGNERYEQLVIRHLIPRDCPL